MNTHSILQTIEILKIINGMDFFSAHERLSILLELGKKLLHEDLSKICSIKVLSVQTEKEWNTLSKQQQSALVQLGTHPLISSEMTQVLYQKTNTEMAPVDEDALERMQEEITKGAEQEYLKWFEEQEEFEASLMEEEEEEEQEEDDVWGEDADWEEEEEELTEEFVFPPAPIQDDNWEIAFVVFQPIEKLFHIRFIRSNKTLTIPCTQNHQVEHPDPHILQATMQKLFPQTEYKNDFASFHTPLFADDSFLKKYNKKKKKLFVLQLRQFCSQPVHTTFSITGSRCSFLVEQKQSWDGLNIQQTQKMTMQWPFTSSTAFPEVGSFVRKKNLHYEFQARTQLSMGWQLSWIAPHSLPIYIEQELHNVAQSSTGNHANTLLLEASSHTNHQKNLPFSHHKMPYSGFVQTRNHHDLVDFFKDAHTYTLKNSPQLGKTPPFQIKKLSKKSFTEASSNHVLSEFRSVCQMIDNTPFSIASEQQRSSFPKVHIPLTESDTLIIESTKPNLMTLKFQDKSWDYTLQKKEEVHEYMTSFVVEDTKQQGWKNALVQDSISETLKQTLVETTAEVGWNSVD